MAPVTAAAGSAGTLHSLIVLGRSRRWASAALLAIVVVSCGPEPREAEDPRGSALERLRVFETSRRNEADLGKLHAADAGPDPVAVARLPGTSHLVGLLRGRSVIVVLDADGGELQRLAAPASPSGLATSPAGDVFVTGEQASEVARYTVRAGRLEPAARMPLAGVRSIRSIAYGPESVLHVVEDHDHRLLTVALGNGAILAGADEPIGVGPRSVLRTPRHVVVDCVLSHEVVVAPVDERGVPRPADAVRVVHDGPIWAVDAVERGDDVLLALGGVEDHPLDRRQGSFGYIDSFAWVYRVPPGGPAERLGVVNVSALGAVTPKVVALRLAGDVVGVQTVGYGSAVAADLEWTAPRPTRKGVWPRPDVTTRPFVPGCVEEAVLDDRRRVLANPLLDAWIVDDGGAPRVVPVPDGEPPRSVESRVGEALLFTTLMAPWNRTKGSLSRFTCETCHLDGVVDGRIHDPGRGNLHVTTKPLLGLFNNRPHFSRALDPDLTSVAHNEFRVAGLRSRHDPWFSIDVAEAPWLAQLGVGGEPLGPEELRRALMVFLMGFGPRPNPSVLGRSSWTAEERRGAEVFHDRCEPCHQARLATDVAASRVPFAEWESLVMSPDGPIVWACDAYAQTGIEPYVHEQGARVTSLRRLYRKRPYFTNGSARDLDAVLVRARFEGGGFWHERSDLGPDAGLDASERHALLAFLDLL